MGTVFEVDWDSLLLPEMGVVEVVFRGLLAYALLCILLRIIPKRQAGSTSPNDMLVLILAGGFATEIMAHEAHSTVDILLMVGAVLACSFLTDWLAYRFPRLRPWLESPPRLIIRNGQLLKHHLHQEMLSEDELAAQLRRRGVEDLHSIHKAYVEINGEVSVVQKKDAGDEEEADELHGLLAGLSLGGRRLFLDNSSPDRLGGPAEAHSLVADVEPELKKFLQAIEDIRAKVNWHQTALDQYKEVLSQHGIRLKALVQATPAPEPSGDELA